MDRPVIETARLLIRRPNQSDIPAIVALVGDWDVVRRLG